MNMNIIVRDYGVPKNRKSTLFALTVLKPVHASRFADITIIYARIWRPRDAVAWDG